MAKSIQQTNVLEGAVSWQLSGGTFGTFEPEIGVRMPSDNQVLITGTDIFIFNQKKFEKLFQYSYKEQLLADQKVDELLKSYKLSFPEGVDLQSLVKDKPGVVKKLQDGIKILGEGEITRPITVTAHIFSATAKQKIEAAGGKALVVGEAGSQA